MSASPLLWANLSLLLLYPVAWAAPLAEARLLPLFGGEEVSILSGLAALWGEETGLALLVALFALVLPYAKTLALAAIHLGRLPARALPLVEFVGKFSMAEVFLVALYIVVAQGAGFVTVESRWGLWLFAACALASLLLSHLTARRHG